MDQQVKEHARFSTSSNGDVFEPTSSNNAKQRANLVEWLNSILPDLNFPINVSDQELRAFLIDGTVLCRILNKLRPGSVIECGDSFSFPQLRSENVKRFLTAMDTMGLTRFQAADLEKGSMKIVLDCLLTLQTQFMPNVGRINGNDTNSRSKVLGERLLNVNVSPINEPRLMQKGNPSATLIQHKFHEVFQLKKGSYTDIPAAKITEMMKSNSLDNAPTQSLLSVANGILDESVERKNTEIPHRVACLLRKVMQEIERRIATQAEHLRTQNNLFKTREEKYQSRIKVLETLATGTSEETQIVMNQLQQIKSEKLKIEEKKKIEEQESIKVPKKNDEHNHEIASLKHELEIVRKMMKENNDHNQEILSLKKELKIAREKLNANEEHNREIASLKQDLEIAHKRMKENDNNNQEIASLKQELENARRSKNDDHIQDIETLKQELEKAKKSHEQQSLQMKVEARGAQQELEKKLNETVSQLTESRKRTKELEAFTESKSKQWNKKEHIYQIFTECQLGALRGLKFASHSIRQEVLRTEKSYSEEFSTLGSKIRDMDDAAKSYYSLLSENQKIHNELQELKGNIRVYCRIRPFLPGQKGKQSCVEYIGENGELVVMNLSKQGKEGHRSFKFNKIYGPTSTQADVFSDTQPLIQSVLDGYNVCIFAYGQTGSGKTYTMSGPDGATEEEWGVNYRALNDLFCISQSRENNFKYEISVQMVEIYNEQVRDLLSNDSPQKKIGIMSTTQPSGLAVPDANIQPVNATSDVLKLMDIGLKNRAKASTMLNERSSRSHSIVSVHVRGMDLKSGSSLRGSLHLVDLAGSERVDRSEVTGDRLKEAQHINKSLSALGDVIFALAQKSAHVPYRNSKLTQVLQSSLGGQAKALMFVQLNPDADSFSESLSTLKFAERVSGVELGAAKSTKDGRDVRELMEQVASLKDTIAKKDEEIERLQEKRGISSLK